MVMIIYHVLHSALHNPLFRKDPCRENTVDTLKALMLGEDVIMKSLILIKLEAFHFLICRLCMLLQIEKEVLYVDGGVSELLQDLHNLTYTELQRG